MIVHHYPMQEEQYGLEHVIATLQIYVDVVMDHIIIQYFSEHQFIFHETFQQKLQTRAMVDSV